MNQIKGCFRLCTAAAAVAAASAVHAQRPYAGPYLPLNSSTVGKLTPSAKYELFSYGPRVSVSHMARLHLGAVMQPQRAVVPPRPTTAASRSLRGYYPQLRFAPVSKPFAHVQPPPTTYEQYWPFLLNARENPRTGRVLLTLP